MSEIKIIDTGKCKLLAVMVPEGASVFKIVMKYKSTSRLPCFEDRLKTLYLTYEGKLGALHEIKLPQGNWQILGLSTEITEEQWYDLVNSLPDPYSNSHHRNYKDYCRNYSITRSQYIFNTAKESGLSLLEANECYSTNPMEPVWEQTDANGTPYNKHFDYYSYLRAYKEAQQNTGTWLILRKL